jgi:hypothetical protein
MLEPDVPQSKISQLVRDDKGYCLLKSAPFNQSGIQVNLDVIFLYGQGGEYA